MPRTKESVLSVSDLEKMLKSTTREIADLERRRAPHAKALAQLDARLAALRGTKAKAPVAKAAPKSKKVRKVTRPRQAKSLKVAIVDVLAGSPEAMGPSEIAAAVQKAGYKTTSKNFLTIVNNTLGQDKRIVRKAKGQYVVRGKGAAKAVKAKKAAPKRKTKVKRAGQPSLETVVLAVLKKNAHPMRPTEITKAALAAGYKTASKYFPTIVSQTLRKSAAIVKTANRRYKLK